MNIYKNLMFLHGHFVDPRDADDDERPAAPAPAQRPAAYVPASRPAQAAPRADWRRWWLRLWPAQSARVETGCDGARCA
ncbi:hypothetical protein [Lysobacter enzymogenes]|uniref:Uncharacterized protein n=1 Tax=Lysobacter enzymogenes TaxID=69 RepID=A0A3N2RN13_LYSEN|nr:hypothetical protein [Lysobacter enzymogenes]ROU08771.1 hypothetical protein D9T17_02985 [Lysobacter enzymogenes]